MSSPVRSVTVRLGMDPSSFVAGAARAEASTLSLDRAVSKVGPNSATSLEKASRSADRAGSSFLSLHSVTSRLGIGVGALAGLTAAAVVKMAGDYQSAVTRLQTTAGESAANLHMVSQGMLDMAGQVGISAQELAKGMYTVESSGMHGADALTVLKAAAQGARQEQADLAHVTDAVTTSLHDYHLPASQAATVTSQLIAAVSHGKTTFDELTGAMHSVEPIAASAGMSIAQTAGALAAMTASGMHADQAAQNLASSIRSFEKPTGTMRDELYQLGLDAQDLSAHLGERGVAGTLQMVSDAIVRKMGPSGQVALDALNKNKAAAQDLGVMIAKMPPALAKLSQGLMDGTVSQMDFRKAAINLGGTAGSMADQFLSLYKSSNGFSAILKSGGPAVQTYIGALGKAVGTSEGLSVALQLTGENAAATNKTIAAVGKAAADAKGNIAGWDEVQKNFNQQLAQAEQFAGKLAIEAGQHLLPILTSGLSWLNEHGPAALHSLGQGFSDVTSAMHPVASVAGGVLDVFKALPGPLQETVLALGALKIAGSMGWLDGVAAAGTKAKVAFQGMRDEMAVQQHLWAMQERSIAEASRGYSEIGGVLSRTEGALQAAGAGATGLEGKFGTLAARGMSGVKAAGMGLMSMFGGPWGLALTGAAVGVAALTSVIEQHDQKVKDATLAVQKWQEAIHFGTSGADDAARHIDNLKQSIADIQVKIDAYNAAAVRGAGRGGIGSLISQQADLKKELDQGTAAWNKQLSVMTPAEIGQQRLAAASYDLGMALKSNNPDKITAAQGEYAAALRYSTDESTKLSAATKTQNQRLQEAATAALSARDAQLGYHLSQLQLNDAIDQYNKDAHDGQHSTRQLAEESDQLAQQAEQTARAAGDAAAQQAKANGATDTGVTSNLAMIKSLEATASHLTGPAHDAVMGMIADLKKSTTQTAIASEAMSNLGLTVDGLPDSHLITIDAPTAKQEAALAHLGYVTVHLPNGKVVVTADTHPALAEIQALLQYARTQSILYRTTLHTIPGQLGLSAPGAATGGQIRGPGTTTSDSIPIFVSDKEFIVNAAATQANLGLLHAINSGAIRGFAGGGLVGPPSNGSTAQVPVRVDHGSVLSVESAIHAAYAAQAAAAAASYSGGAGVEQWRSTVDAVLRALGQSIALDNGILSMIAHESGGNPRAINLWDSNAAAGHPSQGLMQTIPSTFYAYAGPYASRGILDPFANIYAGTNYALQRYGAGMLLQGGNHVGGKYVGYKTGTEYVPNDGLAYLHRGERVITAEDNAALRAVRSREFVGAIAGGGGSYVHTDARSYPITVTAGPSEQRIVRALQDAQRDNEFLHG